jgi:hypothetical protein
MNNLEFSPATTQKLHGCEKLLGERAPYRSVVIPDYSGFEAKNKIVWKVHRQAASKWMDVGSCSIDTNGLQQELLRVTLEVLEEFVAEFQEEAKVKAVGVLTVATDPDDGSSMYRMEIKSELGFLDSIRLITRILKQEIGDRLRALPQSVFITAA